MLMAMVNFLVLYIDGTTALALVVKASSREDPGVSDNSLWLLTSFN